MNLGNANFHPDDARSDEELPLNEFEQGLRSFHPKRVKLDTSVIDDCVREHSEILASGAESARESELTTVIVPASYGLRSNWRTAGVAWCLGLATGLLIAVLANGSFSLNGSADTADFAGQDSPMRDAGAGSAETPTQQRPDEKSTQSSLPDTQIATAASSQFTAPDLMADFDLSRPRDASWHSPTYRGLLVGYTRALGGNADPLDRSIYSDLTENEAMSLPATGALEASRGTTDLRKLRNELLNAQSPIRDAL